MTSVVATSVHHRVRSHCLLYACHVAKCAHEQARPLGYVPTMLPIFRGMTMFDFKL